MILQKTNYTNTADEMIYTDLYFDVVGREDYCIYTKDHDVFDQASLHYPITEQSRKQAFEVLD